MGAIFFVVPLPIVTTVTNVEDLKGEICHYNRIMTMRPFISTLAFLFLITFKSLSFGQNAPFQVHVEPIAMDVLQGVQSFAFGMFAGKWIIVGGRLDGLHKRQQNQSFDIAGHNKSITVVDPIAKLKWTAPLSSLSASLQDQLSSTNMEFHQEGNFLYVIGGYGYSSATASRVTYNKLTAIDVPGLMNAVISGASITPYFRQMTDPDFAVTGGHLKKIYDTWYLVGGHKFDGNYNPMGNPTYTQVYTNAIRKFKINDDGINLTIIHLPSISDPVNLHRRDFNVSPQIMPNGEEGLTAFSGVFQPNADLPYLNSVNIDSSGYSVNAGFAQYFNHYHCATLPLYSTSNQEMHTLFFGGIAQYYENQGILIQDNNVPFVKTIARVTRTADGQMTEYKLPTEMPGYLGSGSEFLVNQNLPTFANGVLKWDDFLDDTTEVGYIVGGISSTAANIFFINTGAESQAYNQILKVTLIKNPNTPNHKINEQSRGGLQMQVFPNPTNEKLKVKFHLSSPQPVRIFVSDAHGKLLMEREMQHTNQGENIFEEAFQKKAFGGIYFIGIQSPTEKAVQKVVLKP